MNRIFYIAFFSLLLFSCGRDEEPKKEPVAEKPAAAETAPKIELLPTTFGALGNWKHDNLSQAVRAFADSCAKISGEKKPISFQCRNKNSDGGLSPSAVILRRAIIHTFSRFSALCRK